MSSFLKRLIDWTSSLIVAIWDEGVRDRAVDSNRFHLACSEIFISFLYLDHYISQTQLDDEFWARQAGLLVEYSEALLGLWCEHRPAEEDDKECADMLALGMYERAFPEYVDQARDMSSLSSVIGSRLIRLIKEPVEYDPAEIGGLACLIFRNEACPMYPDMFQTRF